MNKSALNLQRIMLAFIVAFIADALQLPLTALLASGVFAAPAELGILFVDLVAATLLVAALGFDWLLIPAFAIEAFPLTEAAPAWLLCVALVVWKRYRERNKLETIPPSFIPKCNPLHPAVIEVSPINPVPQSTDPDSEKRLVALQRLFDRGLITQTEFDVHRQEILSQL